MPRQAKAMPVKKANKTNGRKRKSEVLDAEQEIQKEATSDTDEGIVLIAKRIAAKSQNQQQKLRKNQQTAFLGEMKNINDRVPGMFNNHERNCLIQTKLLRLRELLLRRGELDQALTQQTLDLDRLISGAQRSLDTAVQTRKDELSGLRKLLESTVEFQTDGNSVRG